MPVLNPCVSEETVNRSPEPEINARHPLAILKRIGEIFGVTATVLVSQDRHLSIARARFGAMWVFRELGIYSLPEIGRILIRHHTTIISGVKKAERLRVKDAEFLKLTNDILRQVKL